MSYESGVDNKSNIKIKKYLEKEIPKLSSNEHNEIFNIIRNNSSKYSENARGVYINLKFLDNDTISKIKEFIQYTKNSKKSLENNQNQESNTTISNKNQDGKKYDFDSAKIHSELERLKIKNNDNFSFQNFIDKLSVTNIKQFSNNDNRIVYPTLKNTRAKFGGVKARLLKKCREVNKTYAESQFVSNNDTISIDSNEEDDSDTEQPEKTVDINNIINKLGKEYDF